MSDDNLRFIHQNLSQEEMKKMIEDGRAVVVPLDQVFPNRIGDIVDDFFNGYDDVFALYEHLAGMGSEMAGVLKLWNNSLPTESRHDEAWVLKKAHDEIKARIRRSLLSTLNVGMGFPPDFEP